MITNAPYLLIPITAGLLILYFISLLFSHLNSIQQTTPPNMELCPIADFPGHHRLRYPDGYPD